MAFTKYIYIFIPPPRGNNRRSEANTLPSCHHFEIRILKAGFYLKESEERCLDKMTCVFSSNQNNPFCNSSNYPINWTPQYTGWPYRFQSLLFTSHKCINS